MLNENFQPIRVESLSPFFFCCFSFLFFFLFFEITWKCKRNSKDSSSSVSSSHDIHLNINLVKIYFSVQGFLCNFIMVFVFYLVFAIFYYYSFFYDFCYLFLYSMEQTKCFLLNLQNLYFPFICLDYLFIIYFNLFFIPWKHFLLKSKNYPKLFSSMEKIFFLQIL